MDKDFLSLSMRQEILSPQGNHQIPEGEKIKVSLFAILIRLLRHI